MGAQYEVGDAALWRQVLSGTTESFAVVYERYRRQVFTKAFMLTNDVSDAEDVSAIVFLEFWRRREAVRIVEGSLLPWLYKTTGFVASNTARSKRRYRLAIAGMPRPEQSPDIATTVADRVDAVEHALALRDALACLNAGERAVVEHCLVDEMPLSDAASALDLPVGTVKSRLHRARGKLQERFRRELRRRKEGRG